MRFELYVASRYLKAKRRQAVVGVVTAISIAGVAAGVAALIIALAITNGMRRDLQERLLGASAHVDLMRIQSDGIRDWEPLLEKLRRVPHVTAAAPGIYGQVLVSRGPRAGFALIKGIIPAQERTVSSLLETITSGSAKDLAPPAPQAPSQQNADTDSTQDSLPSAINTPYPPLVLGSDLAETIGAQVGDSVLVTSPQGELTLQRRADRCSRCGAQPRPPTRQPASQPQPPTHASAHKKTRARTARIPRCAQSPGR